MSRWSRVRRWRRSGPQYRIDAPFHHLVERSRYFTLKEQVCQAHLRGWRKLLLSAYCVFSRTTHEQCSQEDVGFIYFLIALEPMWLHIIISFLTFTSANWFFLFLHSLFSLPQLLSRHTFFPRGRWRKEGRKNGNILIAMREYVVQPRACLFLLCVFLLKDCCMATAQWPADWLTPTSSVHVTYALVIARMTLQNDTYAQEKCVTDRNSSGASALDCLLPTVNVCIGRYFLASPAFERHTSHPA